VPALPRLGAGELAVDLGEAATTAPVVWAMVGGCCSSATTTACPIIAAQMTGATSRDRR
jgi:hypothetical protein